MRVKKNWRPYFTSNHCHNKTGKTEKRAPCIFQSSTWNTAWGGMNDISSSPVTQEIGHMRGYLCSHKWTKHDECNFFFIPASSLRRLLSILPPSAHPHLPLIMNSSCHVRVSKHLWAIATSTVSYYANDSCLN